MNRLISAFHQDMITTYEEGAKRGYYPTYFMQMLEKHGGVETAKRLLKGKEPQTGLYRLWELGILNVSMEAYVILEKYRPLFTADEIQEARRRLDELNYFRNEQV